MSQENVKKVALAGICTSLALSAIDAMASTKSSWDMQEVMQKELSSENGKRLEALAQLVVSGPRASSAMGHSWFNLSERMQVNGVELLKLYEQEGLGEFLKTEAQGGAANSTACYSACYGNCYGNCYSNCYSNCYGADG